MKYKPVIGLVALLVFHRLVGATVAKDEVCGGQYSGYQYTISSPGYPSNYTGPLNCIYNLQGSRYSPCDQEYHLQFLDFDLRSSDSCRLDYLQINGINIYCGKLTGIRRFRGKNNSLKIVFHSSDGLGAKGFKILVTTLACVDSRARSENSTSSKRDVTFASGTTSVGSEQPPTISTFLFVPPSEVKRQVFRSAVNFDALQSNVQERPADNPTLNDNLLQTERQVEVVATNNEPSSLFPSQKLELPIGHNDVFLENPNCQTGVTPVNDVRIVGSQAVPLFVAKPAIDTRPNPAYGAPNPNFNGFNYAPSASYGPPLPTNYPTVTYQSGFNFEASSNYFPRAPPSNGYYPGSNVAFPGAVNTGSCCGNVYAARNFVLASPGFPNLVYSSNTYDCAYAIRKFSPQVCRLRLTMRYFNYGAEDQYCSNGYVEIGGRRLCGCKNGQSFVVDFPYVTYSVFVRYNGYPRNKLGGFVIDVSQEFCNGFYNGDTLFRNKKDVASVSEDEPKEDEADKDEDTKREKRGLGYSYPKPVLHPWGLVQGHGNGANENLFFGGGCQATSFFQWVAAAKFVHFRGAQCARPSNGGLIPGVNGRPVYPTNGGSGPWIPSNGYPPVNSGLPINPGLPILPGNPGSPGNPGNIGVNQVPWIPGNNGPIDPGNSSPWLPPSGYPGGTGSCESVNVLEGIISSPLYPNAYPNNVNTCYRFYQAPEYCRLNFEFLDFDIETSVGCTKDYVFFNNAPNRRYCGRSLRGDRIVFDFTPNNVIELRFVSDSFGSGKGFNVGFSQIACRGLANFK